MFNNKRYSINNRRSDCLIKENLISKIAKETNMKRQRKVFIHGYTYEKLIMYHQSIEQLCNEVDRISTAIIKFKHSQECSINDLRKLHR